jgi:hypothetical protein
LSVRADIQICRAVIVEIGRQRVDGGAAGVGDGGTIGDLDEAASTIAEEELIVLSVREGHPCANIQICRAVAVEISCQRVLGGAAGVGDGGAIDDGSKQISGVERG